jgi:hypothetical protein
MTVPIMLGMSGPDAYAVVQVVTLTVAMAGAMALARRLGAGRFLRLGMATLWMMLPIVWVSVQMFMMTGWGFALLPTYLVVGWRALDASRARSTAPGHKLALALVLLVSAFMDGYSFVMALVAMTLLFSGALVADRGQRLRIMREFGLPFAVAGLGATVLYAWYTKPLPVVVSPSLEVFRAYALDLAFLVTPSRGATWLWDSLGVSNARDSTDYWGDESVWLSSFLGVLLVAGVISAGAAIRSHKRVTLLFLCITVVGVYLALGPSLKVDSQIPGPGGPSGAMSAAVAGIPMGSDWLWQSVPGFQSMRATYRWLALGALGAWGLTVVGTTALSATSRRATAIVVGGLIFAAVPNLASALHEGRQAMSVADHIDMSLLPEMENSISPNERVLMSPAGNDFIANYLAPHLGAVLYNIGGDRHMVAVRSQWPRLVLEASKVPNIGVRTDVHTDAVVLATALQSGQLDVVVLPFFDQVLYVPCGLASEPESPCHDSYREAIRVLESITMDSDLSEVLAVDVFREFATVRIAHASP